MRHQETNGQIWVSYSITTVDSNILQLQKSMSLLCYSVDNWCPLLGRLNWSRWNQVRSLDAESFDQWPVLAAWYHSQTYTDWQNWRFHACFFVAVKSSHFLEHDWPKLTFCSRFPRWTLSLLGPIIALFVVGSLVQFRIYGPVTNQLLGQVEPWNLQ